MAILKNDEFRCMVIPRSGYSVDIDGLITLYIQIIFCKDTNDYLNVQCDSYVIRLFLLVFQAIMNMPVFIACLLNSQAA